ncbi:unnamed protein product [Sphagnum troendelagicum]|uniref:RNA polymerase Rpb1 domain-containing protein n=1 Tax=Sphagnum troendelagicum TaxID=128251 RepID=A0ABP0TI54_9BRYO
MTYKPMSTLIEKGVEFVSLYFETLDKVVAPEKISQWLQHIELNRSMMVDTKLRILICGRYYSQGGAEESYIQD